MKNAYFEIKEENNGFPLPTEMEEKRDAFIDFFNTWSEDIEKVCFYYDGKGLSATVFTKNGEHGKFRMKGENIFFRDHNCEYETLELFIMATMVL